MEIESPAVLSEPDVPPVHFRVVTENDRTHHVFTVQNGSERWWHWCATFETAELAHEYAGTTLPWRDSLSVSLDFNEITINGKRTHLAPKLCEVLFVLNEKFGTVVRHTYVVSRIWPDYLPGNDDSDHMNQMKVYISHIRTILRHTPFMVMNVWGKGYVLRSRAGTSEGIGP